MSRSDQILKEILREEKKKSANEHKYENENEHKNTQTFMFLYEDEETLYRNIENIKKIENKEITIHPIYIADHSENLNSENVKCRNGKWERLPENIESSWLDIIEKEKIMNTNYKILKYDANKILSVNGIYYHCIDDLTEFFNVDLYNIKISD